MRDILHGLYSKDYESHQRNLSFDKELTTV